MPSRLEIALREDLFDAEGATLIRKARDYFGYRLASASRVRVIMIDAVLTPEERERLRTEVFTNPVTEQSSFAPFDRPADWVIWVGYRPGVKDAAGETAREAIEDLLGRSLGPEEACYTSKLFFLREPADASPSGRLSRADVERLASEILANELVQRAQVYRARAGASDDPQRWNPAVGIGYPIPKVQLSHTPRVEEIPVGSDDELLEISARRHLFLDPRDVPAIRSYFNRPSVRAARRKVGLDLPTDVELEYIAQVRSDHCNHNTFRGFFDYRDTASGERIEIDSLFRTFISDPTRRIARQKEWVISVLWDNAGVGRFDEEHFYTITGETHNSPSNMEAYGGSLTGIVGVYRDPMGTGKGSKLILGTYGFCTGYRDYSGPLKPRLHPRRLLDGIIEGVRDGGNKSGVPTEFGSVFFDHGYMGKCLVYVTAMGIMPAEIDGARSDLKRTRPGELVFMCGGRVGKDGIHGVTASSSIYSEDTPAGHVQIGDPYTQKKMHDFLCEARDQGLIRFITDCGGGGLSSAVGESARFAGGVEVDLDRIPRKYDGLDQWEIWISESQERMIIAVHPDQEQVFADLAARHAVEATVIGRYTDSGFVHLKYEGQTCAYIALDFFESDFPQWSFVAEWTPPQRRGFREPVISEPVDHNACLLAMLARPNLASKEWIQRQYDHEVQGGSVIKPLVGVGRDVPADASVVRPVLDSLRGLAVTQAINPTYSRLDAHAMTAVTIDEAVRRLIAVGGDPEHIGGIDNFCWPEIRHDPDRNPDGKLKAAQLVRSCLALKSSCLAMGIPLLSGKDSMYIDGDLEGPFGERHRVSGLPSLQFTAVSVVPDVRRCVTLEPKREGHRLYILGLTRNELGGSEYYDMYGEVGLHVPRIDPGEVFPMYRALAGCLRAGLVASAHGIYRGGLGVHLALMVMGAGLGLDVDLTRVPCGSTDSASGRAGAVVPDVASAPAGATAPDALAGMDEAAETDHATDMTHAADTHQAADTDHAADTHQAGEADPAGFGEAVLREDRVLYSESAGRLLVTVPAENAEAFEAALADHPHAVIGTVIAEPRLRIRTVPSRELINLDATELRAAWTGPFGDLI